MKQRLLTFFILITSIFIFGCDGDDDDNDSNPVTSQNHSPVIHSVNANPATISDRSFSNSTLLSCVATDPDRDSLNYVWTSPVGAFSGEDNIGQSVIWYRSSAEVGVHYIQVMVNDGVEVVRDSVGVTVISSN